MRNNMSIKGVNTELAADRVKWNKKTSCIDPT